MEGAMEVWKIWIFEVLRVPGRGRRSVHGYASLGSTKWVPIWSVFRISPVSNLHKWPTQGGQTIKNS